VKSNPGYRVLEGRFATIQHAAAVPTGHSAAAACLRDFIEDVKASGFVGRALEEAGAHGVVVAPPVNQQIPPFIKERP
jgi:polar amino acid transport system substrate-binding protein